MISGEHFNVSTLKGADQWQMECVNWHYCIVLYCTCTFSVVKIKYLYVSLESQEFSEERTTNWLDHYGMFLHVMKISECLHTLWGHAGLQISVSL